jgi:hypothetical protein
MDYAERQKPPPGGLYLDHVSHFVADLDGAARLLAALGFSLAPVSVQMHRDGHGEATAAGAMNRCAMLEEGYLEFLMPSEDTPLSREMREAMGRHSGVHLAALGTPVPEEERLRLESRGFAPLNPIALQREVDVYGERELARFTVVRVAANRMPEGRIQYVEQLTPQHLWQERYVAHDNGVTGLAALFVVADDPVEAGARWARFLGGLPRPDSGFVRLEFSRGAVLIGNSGAVEERLGTAPPAPALAGYALKCRHPGQFADRCRKAGLSVNPHGGVSLPPALGGAWLLT